MSSVGIRYFWLQVNPLHTNHLLSHPKELVFLMLSYGKPRITALRSAKKIREKIELRVRDRTRIEEHPNGKSTCWFDGWENVYQQKMRQRHVNYQEIVEEDVNSFERFSEIRYCTFKKCMADYGNEDCKTE